jgi:diguanylate cyclase (GGDEF)-like protein
MEAAFKDLLASVMMVDIDHFKRINDRHGHAVGDDVLRYVARVLSSVLRASDAIVRYGGEEFVLVFRDVGLGRALRIAERARMAVEESHAPIADLDVKVTVSIGVAERAGHEPLEAAVARADKALYEAKAAGRNQVRSAH